jgi:hypothetical protein
MNTGIELKKFFDYTIPKLSLAKNKWRPLEKKLPKSVYYEKLSTSFRGIQLI